MAWLPPRSTLFPYTTLFRSVGRVDDPPRVVLGRLHRVKEVHEALVWEIGRATSELQSHSDLVCRLLLEKKNDHRPIRSQAPGENLVPDAGGGHRPARRRPRR